MKIGIDIRNIGKKRTGDEVVFFNLVKNLAQLDKENNYYLFTDICDEKILEEIRANLRIKNTPNFKIISLETKNKFSWNFWTLPKYLQKNPTDIYLTQYITPFFVPKEIRIMTIIHDVSFCAFPELIKKADLFFLKTLIPLSLKRADKIVAVSQFTLDEIRKYYKIAPEKLDWIHNAVSDEFPKEAVTEEKMETVRKKYDLPKKFILYLGTLQPRKNIPILIEAFNKTDNKFSGMKLVLAGGKGHNYDLKIDEKIAVYNIKDKIIFPGYIADEDKHCFLKMAEIFVFPSLYEGFGIPILEAFASGTPVIASNIPPHREIAGNSAEFFDPQDSGDLADKIAGIISDEQLRKKLVEDGFSRLENFSWKKTAKKMLRIFKDVGNGK